MHAELLAVLLAADDPVGTDEPVGFNRQVEAARLRPLVPLVEAVVGRPFAFHWGQDASFLTDIVTFDRGTVRGHSGPAYFGVLFVRFSNFGRLFTVWSVVAPEKQLPPAVVTRVIDLVAQHGYQYVPVDEVEGEPYTGANPDLQCVNWFRRFFEYL